MWNRNILILTQFLKYGLNTLKENILFLTSGVATYRFLVLSLTSGTLASVICKVICSSLNGRTVGGKPCTRQGCRNPPQNLRGPPWHSSPRAHVSLLLGFTWLRFTDPALGPNWRSVATVSSESPRTILPVAFAHCVCLCHILVILEIFKLY